jgi:probable rRNA maturation factor
VRRAQGAPPQPVQVAWRVRRRLLSDRALRSAARSALEHGRRPGAGLSIVLVGDRALARMHARWLGDPRPTDVITFDLGGGPDGEVGPAGELYVSVERAEREARHRGLDPRRELLLYVVHGVLHLCGFDDRTGAERRAMRRAEERVLAALGMPIGRSTEGRRRLQGP